MLRDANGDGRADGAPKVVANRAGAHGLAIKDGKLYLATVKEVFVADIRPDGTLGPLTMLIGDLPDAGQHPNRTMAFGPDGMLYISVGSTCNACNESNPENATMLRATPDGKSRTIFAIGPAQHHRLRLAPETGELWGMDHGIDFLGDEVQPEELNRSSAASSMAGRTSGATAASIRRARPVGEISKEQWKAQSTPMVAGLHGACRTDADAVLPRQRRSRPSTRATRSSPCAARGTASRPRATRSSASTSRTASRSRSSRS